MRYSPFTILIQRHLRAKFRMSNHGNEKYQQAREPANRYPAPVLRHVAGAVDAKCDAHGEHQPNRDFGRLAW